MFLCNFKGEWWDDYEATSTSATAPYIARSVLSSVRQHSDFVLVNTVTWAQLLFKGNVR